MKRYLLAAVAALAIGGVAHAAEQHTITGIAGAHVQLDDGSTYSTDSDISGWSVGDHVTVTDDHDKMINGDDEADVDEE
jgi:hypothetical protein